MRCSDFTIARAAAARGGAALIAALVRLSERLVYAERGGLATQMRGVCLRVRARSSAAAAVAGLRRAELAAPSDTGGGAADGAAEAAAEHQRLVGPPPRAGLLRVRPLRTIVVGEPGWEPDATTRHPDASARRSLLWCFKGGND